MLSPAKLEYSQLIKVFSSGRRQRHDRLKPGKLAYISRLEGSQSKHLKLVPKDKYHDSTLQFCTTALLTSYPSLPRRNDTLSSPYKFILKKRKKGNNGSSNDAREIKAIPSVSNSNSCKSLNTKDSLQLKKSPPERSLEEGPSIKACACTRQEGQAQHRCANSKAKHCSGSQHHGSIQTSILQAVAIFFALDFVLAGGKTVGSEDVLNFRKLMSIISMVTACNTLDFILIATFYLPLKISNVSVLMEPLFGHRLIILSISPLKLDSQTLNSDFPTPSGRLGERNAVPRMASSEKSIVSSHCSLSSSREIQRSEVRSKHDVENAIYTLLDLDRFPKLYICSQKLLLPCLYNSCYRATGWERNSLEHGKASIMGILQGGILYEFLDNRQVLTYCPTANQCLAHHREDLCCALPEKKLWLQLCQVYKPSDHLLATFSAFIRRREKANERIDLPWLDGVACPYKMKVSQCRKDKQMTPGLREEFKFFCCLWDPGTSINPLNCGQTAVSTAEATGTACAAPVTREHAAGPWMAQSAVPAAKRRSFPEADISLSSPWLSAPIMYQIADSPICTELPKVFGVNFVHELQNHEDVGQLICLATYKVNQFLLLMREWREKRSCSEALYSPLAQTYTAVESDEDKGSAAHCEKGTHAMLQVALVLGAWVLIFFMVQTRFYRLLGHIFDTGSPWRGCPK
eukprot:bmy_05504T0